MLRMGMMLVLIGGMSMAPATVQAQGFVPPQETPSTPEKQPPPGRGHGGYAELPPMQAAPSIQAITETEGHVLFVGSFGNGIFRSVDRGNSWAPSNAGLTDPFILCLQTDGSIVYAGTARGKVFRTTDGGESWEGMHEGLRHVEVKALLIERDTIYAGTGNGVYTWNERDQRWSVLSPGLEQILVHSLVMTRDRTIFAGTSGKGVMRLDPVVVEGSEWTRLPNGIVDHEGLVENYVREVAVGPAQDIYIGTFGGGVFRSQNGGETWSPISRSLPNNSIRGIVPGDDGLFVATGQGIFKNSAETSEWVGLNEGLEARSVQTLYAADDGSLYAGTNAGAFRSDDRGKHWINISAGLGSQGQLSNPYRQ